MKLNSFSSILRVHALLHDKNFVIQSIIIIKKWNYCCITCLNFLCYWLQTPEFLNFVHTMRDVCGYTKLTMQFDSIKRLPSSIVMWIYYLIEN